MPIDPVIDNREGSYEISLAKIVYYNGWVNISEALRNNKFRYGTIVHVVRDGYNNVCNLHKQHFVPIKLELTLHADTGLISELGNKRQIHHWHLREGIRIPQQPA